jgi:hypothetical protein
VRLGSPGFRCCTCKAAATETAGRFSRPRKKQIGYVACVDAQVVLLTAFHYMKKALAELRQIGDTTVISCADFMVARKAVEDLIRLDEYYAIEEETVEGQNLKLPNEAVP